MPSNFDLDLDVLKAVSGRGIQHVYHFTTTLNLINIFRAGYLLNRQALEALSIESGNSLNNDTLAMMDENRLDGYKGHINVSIGHPNIYLLDRYKRDYQDAYNDWCVIDLSPDVLAKKSTLFSVSNAASTMSQAYGINMGVDSLNALFQDEVRSLRYVFSRSGLKTSDPTDVQAEALIPGEIDVALIQRVVFRSNESKAIAVAMFKGVEAELATFVSCFEVDPSLFEKRVRS